MNPDEAAALLTYTNQADPLVSLNDANADIWWEALKRHDFDKAKWCIKDYYANTAPARDGRIPPITPSVLRHRIGDKTAIVESKHRALEPPKNKTPSPVTFRSKDPERWDALVAQGAAEYKAGLRARGMEPHADSCPECSRPRK